MPKHDQREQRVRNFMLDHFWSSLSSAQTNYTYQSLKVVLRLFSVLAEYSVIRELETEGAAGLQIEAVSRGEIIRDGRVG